MDRNVGRIMGQYGRTVVSGMIAAFLCLTFLVDQELFAARQSYIPTKSPAISALPFLANDGQVQDQEVLFYGKLPRGTVFVSAGDGITLTYSFQDQKNETGPGISSRGWVLKEKFVKSRPTIPVGAGKSASVSHFLGRDAARWVRNGSAFEGVHLGEVYEGIEVRLKWSGNTVEKVFVVHPGASPSTIKMRVDGTGELKIGDGGELVASVPAGEIAFSAPIAYQETEVGRRFVPAAYEADGRAYGFVVGSYDTAKALVIDPLVFSTFVGGSSFDDGVSMSLDGDGNIVLAGTTDSSDFPTTAGPHGTTGGYRDVFVLKLSPDLANLLSAAYLGGNGLDGNGGLALTVDSQGDILVTGNTSSLNFPVTSSAFGSTYGGSGDGFVVRLDSSLQNLLASAYIGGSDYEIPRAIKSREVGGQPAVFVVGETGSMDFPSVSSSYSTIYNGGANDSFIVRLNHNLDLLEASTYIGGSQDEDIYALDFDNQDNVCIVLRTASPDYPILPGAFQSTLKGSEDGAVSKLNPDLTSLLASTYLGGSGSDYLSALAFDGSGDLVVAGWTNSVDFPTTAGAFDTTFNGVNDVIVSRFDSTLSTLSTSTFLGGSQGDALSRSQTSMVLGSTGDVFLSGSTFSPDYPVAGACFDTNYDGNEDAFLTRLDSALTRVRGSSYIGGSGTDRGRSIALGSGNIYVTGFTNSADFPTTEGAYSRVLTGANDAFVSRFTPDLTLGSDGGGGGGCFIATAVFQQSNGERYIRTFKNFRDQRLLGNPLGERLVGIYYRLSPPVADWIKDHPLAGKILAPLLMLLATVLEHAVFVLWVFALILVTGFLFLAQGCFRSRSAGQ